MRIALVEDHALTALAVVMHLHSQQHQVDVFAEGATAIAALSAGNQYDVMLLDLRLPDMDGAEVLANLRAHGVDCPPVVLFTAQTEGKIANLARQFGVLTCIIKPFPNEALDDALAMVRERQ